MTLELLTRKLKYKKEMDVLKELDVEMSSVSSILQNLVKMSAASTNGKLKVAT